MSRKILIVDDSLLIRKVTAQVFSKQEYETLEATDGKEALKVIDQSYKDIMLIITDWNMPNMNGFELLQKIKSSKTLCDIPVIIATTESEKGHINKALKAGAADYIIKPFNAQELIKTTAKYLLAQ